MGLDLGGGQAELQEGAVRIHGEIVAGHKKNDRKKQQNTAGRQRCGGCACARLQNRNLRLFDTGRPAGHLGHLLSEDQALEPLGVINCSAQLLHNLVQL